MDMYAIDKGDVTFPLSMVALGRAVGDLSLNTLDASRQGCGMRVGEMPR